MELGVENKEKGADIGREKVDNAWIPDALSIVSVLSLIPLNYFSLYLTYCYCTVKYHN